jgi:hypothetical protein
MRGREAYGGNLARVRFPPSPSHPFFVFLVWVLAYVKVAEPDRLSDEGSPPSPSSQLPRVGRVGIERVDGRDKAMDDDIARPRQQGPDVLAIAAIVGRGVVRA